VYRLTGQEIKLSEMFTVYWEYVERAKRFIAERGKAILHLAICSPTGKSVGYKEVTKYEPTDSPVGAL
jgi:hypothetical protein